MYIYREREKVLHNTFFAKKTQIVWSYKKENKKRNWIKNTYQVNKVQNIPQENNNKRAQQAASRQKKKQELGDITETER